MEAHDEPIDLAQKAAEKGNPWFGLRNLLAGNTEGEGVYTHTFLSEQPRQTLSDVMIDELRWHLNSKGNIELTISGSTRSQFFHQMRRRRMRAERWRKIRKRQRRAAQRRHERGER